MELSACMAKRFEEMVLGIQGSSVVFLGFRV